MVKHNGAVLRAVGLWALCAGCAGSITAQDVRRWDNAGDVDRLLKEWKAGPPASVQPALLDALARHPDDERTLAVIRQTARRHPQEAVRRRGIERLAAYPNAATMETLIAALGDRFSSVRAQAKAALGAMDDAYEPLQTAGRADANPLIRAAALDLMTQAALRHDRLQKDAAFALAERARRDDAPAVRARAASGLGALNAIGSRRLLTEMMRTDDDANVRMQAGRALGKLDAPAAQERKIIAVLPLKNATGDKALVGFGDQVAAVLTSELSASGVCEVIDPQKRDAAIEEIKKTGSQLYDGDRPNAPELGEFALADQFAFGVVQKTGLVYTILLNRMDVSTLKLIPGASVTVRGYRADLDRLKVEAARKFVARFR